MEKGSKSQFYDQFIYDCVVDFVLIQWKIENISKIVIQTSEQILI